MKDLTIITVNTNDGEKIIEQILSVREGAKTITYEHIVSDNGSSDGSREEITRRFPDMKIIENGKNIGFGAANNRALRLAEGRFLLFLNPDMRVTAGSLDAMVRYMDTHEQVGVASCLLTDQSGRIQQNALPRRFPGFFDQVCVLLKIPHLFPRVLNRYLYRGRDFSSEQKVDTVRGSFMMMRRVIADQLGWAFDPRYFVWFEDVDTCRETRRLGYEVVHTPHVSCVDYVGQTFRKQPTMLKQKRFMKSMFQYFQKWHPWYQWIGIAVVLPFSYGISWVFSLIQRVRHTNQ